MTLATDGATLDVHDTASRERHAIVFAAFKALAFGDAPEIETADGHGPKPPLHLQFQVEALGDFSWICVRKAPDDWQVSLQQRRPAGATRSLVERWR